MKMMFGVIYIKDLRRWGLLAGLLTLGACGGLQWPPPGESQGGYQRQTQPRPPSRRQAAARKTEQMVTVRQGDNLFILSQRHGVDARAIIDTNGLRPPYRLNPGQRLRIPAPMQYRVAGGDTLYSISRHFGLDVFELARLNRLAEPYKIYAGQELSLSGGAISQPPIPLAQRSTARPANEPAGKQIDSLPAPRARPGRFIWPVSGKVVSAYGPKGEGLHNDGINISARRGDPVRAARSGTVAYAGNELRGFGNLLLIRHPGGWVTAYAHNENLLVKRGEKVRQGQVIARVGTSGNVINPQLHFEIRRGKRAVNPKSQLAAAPSST